MSTVKYDVIIPETILHDDKIIPQMKLVYGELLALCNDAGYCDITTQYFADAYMTNINTVYRWITGLHYAGYIRVEHNINNYLTIYICTEEHLSMISKFKNSLRQSEDIEHANEIKEIIDYLNNKTGSRYRYSSKETVKLIRARLNEKFTVDDFKKVIDNKAQQWTGTEFQQYLRPETLFGSRKFEQYLNQKTYVPPQKQTQRTQWDGTIVGDKVF